MSDGANQTTTTLYGPDDAPIQEIGTTVLSKDEAELLRKYKKFLAAHNLKEALYCGNCWDGMRDDGCKAFVTDAQIGILCRCHNRFYQGSTF